MMHYDAATGCYIVTKETAMTTALTMPKIPTVFERDPAAQFKVVPRLTLGCEWVKELPPEGSIFATVKVDGICMKWDGVSLYRRLRPADGSHEASFVKVSPDDEDAPVLNEALENAKKDGYSLLLQPGIYEAFGPKIGGNHHNVDRHSMIRINPVCSSLMSNIHSSGIVRFPVTTVDAFYHSVKQALTDSPDIEGIVWHHEKFATLLRAAKIKRKDFGLEWPVAPSTTPTAGLVAAK